jgi:uncharacterized membrane protein
VRFPFAPLPLLALLALLLLLAAVVQLGALTLAFDKLGLSPGSAVLLLVASLLGSAVNLPLFRVRAERPPQDFTPPRWRRLLRLPERPFTGWTVIAVNAGGCLVPVAFSLYLLAHSRPPAWQVLVAVAGVTALSRLVSRPLPGIGIGMPPLVAPLAAALIAILLGGTQGPALAYVGGTLGVLIGADLLRLGDIRKIGTPFAAIGGAGTFDGIFITGIIAVLLA